MTTLKTNKFADASMSILSMLATKKASESGGASEGTNAPTVNVLPPADRGGIEGEKKISAFEGKKLNLKNIINRIINKDKSPSP